MRLHSLASTICTLHPSVTLTTRPVMICKPPQGILLSINQNWKKFRVRIFIDIVPATNCSHRLGQKENRCKKRLSRPFHPFPLVFLLPLLFVSSQSFIFHSFTHFFFTSFFPNSSSLPPFFFFTTWWTPTQSMRSYSWLITFHPVLADCLEDPPEGN